MRLKPDSVEALANLGKVHTLWKNYEQALPYLERALELRPDYATALSTLGGVHIELRNYEKAEEILNHAAGLRSSKETQVTIHGNLGILCYKTGRRDQAKQRFEKVLELDPEDRQAQAVLERLRRPRRGRRRRTRRPLQASFEPKRTAPILPSGPLARPRHPDFWDEGSVPQREELWASPAG